MSDRQQRMRLDSTHTVSQALARQCPQATRPAAMHSRVLSVSLAPPPHGSSRCKAALPGPSHNLAGHPVKPDRPAGEAACAGTLTWPWKLSGMPSVLPQSPDVSPGCQPAHAWPGPTMPLDATSPQSPGVCDTSEQPPPSHSVGASCPLSVLPCAKSAQQPKNKRERISR